MKVIPQNGHLENPTFKVVCLGKAGVGKSAFVASACNLQHELNTRSLDVSRKLEILSYKKPIDCYLWDVPSSFSDIYVQEANAIIIFLDSTLTLEENEESLRHYRQKIDQARQQCFQAQIFVLLTKENSHEPILSSRAQIAELVAKCEEVVLLESLDVRKTAKSRECLRTIIDSTRLHTLTELLKTLEFEALKYLNWCAGLGNSKNQFSETLGNRR